MVFSPFCLESCVKDEWLVRPPEPGEPLLLAPVKNKEAKENWQKNTEFE